MDTQKVDLNNGQENKENKENKKNEEINEAGLVMGAAGLVAAGVVGSQLLSDEQQDTPAEDETPIDTTPATNHPQQAQTHPQDEPVEVTPPPVPEEDLLANANEPVPIAPDRPGVPTDDNQFADNDGAVTVDIDNANEDELIAIAEQIVNDPVDPTAGDDLAVNDHVLEDIVSGDIEVLDEPDLIAELDDITGSEETAMVDVDPTIMDDMPDETGMEEYEAPLDILDDSDPIDDILSDISYDAPEDV